MDSKETLLRIVLLTLLIYASVSIAAVGRELQTANAMESRLLTELDEQEEVNAALRQKIAGELNDEEIERLARERLGLVKPGEIIFYFCTDREE